MGHPTSGNITFVSLMQTCSVNGSLDGIDKLHNSTCLSFCRCKDLYLELIPSRNGLKLNDSLANSSTSETKFYQSQNGNVSSPKTPSIDQSKLSPAGVCLSNEASFSAYDMEEATDQEENIEKELGDNRIRKMYENFAVLGLHGRLLLHGNVVSIPMLKKTYLFCVEDGNKLSIECPSQELIAEGSQLVLDNEEFETPTMVHQEVAFVLGAETKVHICTVPLITQIPNERGLPLVEIDCKNIKDKLADHVPKLGGLSKEFALLKDIIVSSLLKNTLSRFDTSHLYFADYFKVGMNTNLKYITFSIEYI